MPYTGPSRGCLTCRSRKVKCDEARPTCKRCANAKRPCSGYPEESSFIFRNENESARRRALRRRNTPSTSPEQSDTDFSYDAIVQLGHANATDLTPRLSPPAEQRAFYAFIKDFVLFPDSLARGYMEYIPTEFERSKDSCLGFTVTALSIAHLARRVGDPDLMAKARQGYSKALAATNASISSAVGARDDRTLMAVLLLCYFEILLYLPRTVSRPMSGWQSHIQGAAALIRFRGPDLLNSDLGMRLFLAHRSQMTKASLESGRSAFAFSDWILPEAAYKNRTGEYSPSTPLGNIIFRITKFVRIFRMHVDGDPGEFPPVSEAPGLMAEALEIDIALQEWADSIPLDRRPSLTDFGTGFSSDSIYDGKIEMYNDLWYAGVWNEYRGARITLLKCIVALVEVYPNLPPPPPIITTLMQQLVNGICASLPYHLGCRVTRDEENGHTVLRDYGESMPGRAMAALLLVWPMYAAVFRTPIAPAQRRWLVRAYEILAEKRGLSQGRALAESVRFDHHAEFCEESPVCKGVIVTEQGRT